MHFCAHIREEMDEEMGFLRMFMSVSYNLATFFPEYNN